MFIFLFSLSSMAWRIKEFLLPKKLYFFFQNVIKKSRAFLRPLRTYSLWNWNDGMYVRRVVVTFKEGFVSYTVKWFRIFCLLMFLNGKSSFVTEGLTISWTIFGTANFFSSFLNIEYRTESVLNQGFSYLAKYSKSCKLWRFFVHCDSLMSIVCERIVCLLQGFSTFWRKFKIQKIKIFDIKSTLCSWIRKMSWEF